MERAFRLEYALPLSPRAVAPTWIDQMDINADIVSLTHSTSITGGFNGLICGIERSKGNKKWSGLTNPADLRFLSYVRLHAGASVIWEGEARLLDFSDSGRVTGFTASGLGISALNDNWYYSTSLRRVTSGVAIRSALPGCAPLIHLGNKDQLQDSGVPFQLAEFSGQYASQILNRIQKAGFAGDLGVMFHDYQVWEEQTLWMRPRRPPLEGPQYMIPFDKDVLQIQGDASNLAGAVSVQFTPLHGKKQVTATQEESTFRDRFNGRIIATLVQNSVMGEYAANSYRDRYLNHYSKPIFVGKASFSAFEGPRLSTGAMKLPQLVKAGEWVSITPHRGVPLTLSFPPMVITSTNCDDNLGTLELSLSSV